MADATDRTPAIKATGLGFGYHTGGWILRDCNLTVERGRVLAILGPNGRGKTTLLKLLAGSLVPREGSVLVSSPVAFLPQAVQAYFAYSALEMVLMGRARHVGLFAVPTKHDEAIATESLERMGLTALASRPFDQLSGGERQLVLFARALASKADTLILDEPGTGLDLRNQGLILHWIKQLARDGLTIVFTSHQPQHASAVADDALLMFEGGRQLAGPASSTITEAHLSELFGVELRQVQVQKDGRSISGIVPIWPA